MRYERHLFLCTLRRDGGGKPSCGARDGVALLAAVERELATRGSAGKVAVTACGCLGPCFDGPNAVVYPDGVWYAGLEIEDAAALVSYLLGGPELEHRRYHWDA